MYERFLQAGPPPWTEAILNLRNTNLAVFFDILNVKTLGRSFFRI
jgi:hypothetical protein